MNIGIISPVIILFKFKKALGFKNPSGMPSSKTLGQAKMIEKLVNEGALKPEYFDFLIKEGVDKEAVECWKKSHG
jgi:hypothetical protein